MLSTFMLRVGIRCSNAKLYYGAMEVCMSLLYRNKNNNYIRMLNFELSMINKAPKQVKSFIFVNIFQRNKNHKNQNTAQEIDYKLEECNTFSKQNYVSVNPSIDDWTRIASATPKFKYIVEHQSEDYNLDLGIFSEPGAPDYSKRIRYCRNQLRNEEVLTYDSHQGVCSIYGKPLDTTKSLDFENETERWKYNYLASVKENQYFIKAELDFIASVFTK